MLYAPANATQDYKDPEQIIRGFSLQPYIDAVNAENSLDWEQDDDPITTAFSSCLFDPLTEEEERQSVIDTRQQQEDLLSKETAVWDVIRKYDYGVIEPAIKPLIKQFKKNLKEEKEDIYPVTLALDIGDFYRNKGDIHKADFFYNLTSQGWYHPDFCRAKLHQGEMHLELFQQKIPNHGKIKPTTTMLYNIGQAINAFPYSEVEALERSVKGLEKVQRAIIYYYFSYTAALSDSYYGQNILVRKIYSEQFLREAAKQIAQLHKLVNVKKYDGTGSTLDLAGLLKQEGFYGILESATQHIWVNARNFSIRVKAFRENEGKITKYPHFTFGYLLESPFYWQNGQPFGLASYPELGSNIAFDRYNEICKFAIVPKINKFFIIPAFRDYYWYCGSLEENIMTHAHYPLQRTDHKKVESMLRFKRIR